MNNTLVEFKAADVYGRMLYYPANEVARMLLTLAGRNKSFVPAQVATIKALGYKVIIASEGN